MTDIPLQVSMIHSNRIIGKKREQILSNNLFNNHQRNLPMSSNATLPIITLSSFSNFEQKFIQMAMNNKNTSTNFRMACINSPTRDFNRSNTPFMSKSFLNYPTLSQQQKSRCKPKSARNNLNPLPSQQQPMLSRPYTQYSHFLTYLRRQSLARLRRKQEEKEGNTDHVETTITLNLNKQSFQSSFASLTADTSSTPIISIKANRTRRSSSSYRPIKTYQQTPPPLSISKNSINDQLLTSSSLLITPRNSVVDDKTISPIIKPYELYLNDDMLNYCYINDDNRIKYQRPILSTAV